MGYDFAADTNVVDVFIGYLRRKLEARAHRACCTPCAASASCCALSNPATNPATDAERRPQERPTGAVRRFNYLLAAARAAAFAETRQPVHVAWSWRSLRSGKHAESVRGWRVLRRCGR